MTMFVVGILRHYLNDSGYKRCDLMSDRLYESTAAAEAEIARILYEKRKEKYIEDCQNAFDGKHSEYFEQKSPPPLNPARDLPKPAYDHNRDSDKDYQREHAARIQRWREEEFYPAQCVWQE